MTDGEPAAAEARTRLRTALEGDPVGAARELLGAVLRHGPVALRVVETEAYDGRVDEASHSFRGETDRTRVMFGPAGRLYVYFSYGMHWAANVSCSEVGHGAAVLLRAGEVIDGVEFARDRRGPRVTDRDLARGPGRLTQALGIDRRHYGADLLAGTEIDGVPLRLEPRTHAPEVATGPRVGISRSVDLPWRFWIPGDRYVSAFRPGQRR
ncbi:DNA-3-methyladenine glycosylase [Friedmanniella endophytica]|uniref:Putative 3-methyladenine DNA glycosylase n=1 Tax=Microlunatus kandeliicorticis TaxID=1759536 RepID=A0A7W3P507_9ACTN|nr:DNA-3-methyladenine glycosylase [Microlunatus kandeliicorticis]MBA8793469.1 DNA-3-methyladenine glycosylase [Microlunatus kandeliicorticis]